MKSSASWSLPSRRQSVPIKNSKSSDISPINWAGSVCMDWKANCRKFLGNLFLFKGNQNWSETDQSNFPTQIPKQHKQPKQLKNRHFWKFFLIQRSMFGPSNQPKRVKKIEEEKFNSEIYVWTEQQAAQASKKQNFLKVFYSEIYVWNWGESRSTSFLSMIQAWTNSCLKRKQKSDQSVSWVIQPKNSFQNVQLRPGHFSVRVDVHPGKDTLGPLLRTLLLLHGRLHLSDAHVLPK